MLRETRVFDGVMPVLDALDARGLPLGHRHQQGDALRRAAGRRRWACDRARGAGRAATPRRTPSRIRRRCSKRRAGCGVAAASCVYVGDDLRDVQAGRAAGMRTLAAAWGYLGDGDAIERLGRRSPCWPTPRRRS